MHITDLDEYPGVTSEMIREWLRKRGWVFQAGKHRYWERGKDNFADSLIDGNRDDVAFVIHCEELASGMSPQEALREINPRMRKGMPSQAALAAHDHWLVRDTETGEISLHRAEGGFLYSVNQYRNGTKNPDSEALPDFGTWMEFWPCDKHGNKVRWVEQDGVML